MKTFTKTDCYILLTFAATSIFVLVCLINHNNKGEKEEKIFIEQTMYESQEVPIRYFVLKDNNSLYDAPEGKALKSSSGSQSQNLTIDRDDVVIIKEEKGEWVRVQATDCSSLRSEAYQGWVKREILTESDYIDYHVQIMEGRNYKVLYIDDMPLINLRNYFIKLHDKNFNEAELLNIASTLRRKYHKSSKRDCQIWLYDEEPENLRMFKSGFIEPTIKELLFKADHLVYFLSAEARIGEYYPLQVDYEEYKSYGGKKWKK